jgi:hypothetical protein
MVTMAKICTENIETAILETRRLEKIIPYWELRKQGTAVADNLREV